MDIDEEMDIALYVGAGDHIYPITDLPHIKTFYYLDSQPNSEYGFEKYGFDGIKVSSGERPEFIANLDTKMAEFGIQLTTVVGNLRMYSNNEQHIYYYTNTAIPELYEEIKTAFENYNTLIISGFSPDSIILDATNKPIHLILYQDTCYGEFEENPNSIINRLHRGEINDRFYKYTMISQDSGGMLESTGEQISFDTWESFYKFHYNLYD